MVTVYYTWIPDNLAPAREACWLSLLPTEKRDAIKRLRLAKGRAASLLGLQLLKYGMRAYGFADFELSAVRFPRGGKPECQPSIDFNITHSRNMVACALSSEGAIGIDTEQLRVIEIASFGRFLKPDEYAWIGEDRRRFFELWTQKEAVVKAHGDGGIANLRRVSIAQSQGTLASQTWALHALDIHPDYATHLATRADLPGASIKIEYVEFSNT